MSESKKTRVAAYGPCDLREVHNAHTLALDLQDTAGIELLQECPGQYSDCRNCDDRRCMACVFREIHDQCAHDCPDCGDRAEDNSDTAPPEPLVFPGPATGVTQTDIDNALDGDDTQLHELRVSSSIQKNADRPRETTFYGRAVSLDGPLATVTDKNPASYDQNVRGLMTRETTAAQDLQAVADDVDTEQLGDALRALIRRPTLGWHKAGCDCHFALAHGSDEEDPLYALAAKADELVAEVGRLRTAILTGETGGIWRAAAEKAKAEAVRERAARAAFNAKVATALHHLDGTENAAVGVLARLCAAELEDLGQSTVV